MGEMSYCLFGEQVCYGAVELLIVALCLLIAFFAGHLTGYLRGLDVDGDVDVKVRVFDNSSRFPDKIGHWVCTAPDGSTSDWEAFFDDDVLKIRKTATDEIDLPNTIAVHDGSIWRRVRRG